MTAPLRSVLHDNAILLRSLDSDPPFSHVVAHRFFDVDVLTGLSTPNGHQGVPVVRRRNRDRIHVFVIEGLSNITDRLRRVLATVPIGNVLDSSNAHVVIWIDDIGDFDILLAHPTTNVATTTAIYAADRNAKPVVRPHRAS